MRRTPAICLAIGLLSAAVPAMGQEPTASPGGGVEPPAAAKVPSPSKGPSASLMAEAAAARVVTIEKLRALGRPPEKGQEREKAAEARIAALREVFKAREILLVEWDKTTKARQAVEHPDPTPEAELAEQKVALERVRGSLARAGKEKASLLPDLFRTPMSQTTDASLNEMKEAIAAAEDAADTAKKDLDASHAALAKKGSTPLAVAKAERDEIRKQIAALSPRNAEADAALASAGSAEERELVREKLVDLLWEGRVQNERLKEADSRIELETRRAEARQIKIQVERARLDLAKITLEALQSEFRNRVDRHQADEKRASAIASARAEHASDPLERYKGRRNKEIADQRTLCDDLERELNSRQEMTANAEKEKTDKAEGDFKRLKDLVKGGRSSALVAQRLNNSFRRLGGERAAIVRNELARITLQLGRYENDLTAVELDQLNDARGDEALREILLASLPTARKDEAVAAFAEMESKNRDVLEKRRQLLITLEKRAEETRQQVLRRIKILDDQHAFVRTHLFWVRDSQPMGFTTAEQFRREARELAGTVLGIVSAPRSRSHWERVSPEFGLAALGLILLPYGLHRGRRALRRILERERLGQAVSRL